MRQSVRLDISPSPLHAHLPYVVNHGTWPHGMEWLHEACRGRPTCHCCGVLGKPGAATASASSANLNLSPILLEQLSHPVFITEFPKYVTRKDRGPLVRTRPIFCNRGEGAPGRELARFWHRFFSAGARGLPRTRRQYHWRASATSTRPGPDRHHHPVGATHGYMPLLGTDERRTAPQIRHRRADAHPPTSGPPIRARHLGSGVRPTGLPGSGIIPCRLPMEHQLQAFDRNRPLKQATVGVPTSSSFMSILIWLSRGHRVPSPYELLNGEVPTDELTVAMTAPRSPARPLSAVITSMAPTTSDTQRRSFHAIPRNRHPGLVRRFGLSGAMEWYLDFHKKRWPGGPSLLARGPGPRSDLGDKQAVLSGRRQPSASKSHASPLRPSRLRGAEVGPSTMQSRRSCARRSTRELFGHWVVRGDRLWLEGDCTHACTTTTPAFS